MINCRCTRWKVIFSIWICLSGIDAMNLQGSLPSIPAIASLVQQYIKPYLKIESPQMRARKTNHIEKIIDKKINELKANLQDREDFDDGDRLTLHGEADETTIIEFVPPKKEKNTELRNKNELDFQSDIHRYKKLRKKIKKALEHEPVSENTKKLVRTTVDDMVASIIGNECSWKAGALRTNKKKLEPVTLANVWTEVWSQIRQQYLRDKKKSGKDDKKDTALFFMDNFHEFVTKIINSTHLMTNHYAVECTVVDPRAKSDDEDNNTTKTTTTTKPPTHHKKKGKQVLRDDSIENNSSCKIQICSRELKDFMIDFYLNLNDTAVTTLRSYSAMFIRDVNPDNGNEKETVVGQLNKTSREIEHKIDLIFRKQTDKFDVQKTDDNEKNYETISAYIRRAINHVKKQIMNDLGINLSKLRQKLMLNIQKDIDVNLDVDLGNLERDMNAKICSVFEQCNGKGVKRRMGAKHIDADSLYVKVKFTMDETTKPDRRIGLNVEKAMKGPIGSLNVTRTTFRHRDIMMKKKTTKPNTKPSKPIHKPSTKLGSVMVAVANNVTVDVRKYNEILRY